MAVVMLTEGCSCNSYTDMVRNADPGKFCGCIVSEPAMLSANAFDRFGSWLENKFQGENSGWCPACHRVVDNLGDTVVNLAGLVSNVPGYANYLVGTTVNAAGNIIQGAGAGVGGFISNPDAIPCIANAVGMAYGVPLGLGGCNPSGYNEQFNTMPPPQPEINPLLLYGGAALALILLLK